MKREQPDYLRLRGKNGDVVTVDLRTGNAYIKTTQPKRRDEDRIRRRHESTAKLMRQLEEEREESRKRNQNDGCFGALLALLMGAGAIVGIAGQWVG
jgi:hypothetical protein